MILESEIFAGANFEIVIDDFVARKRGEGGVKRKGFFFFNVGENALGPTSDLGRGVFAIGRRENRATLRDEGIFQTITTDFIVGRIGCALGIGRGLEGFKGNLDSLGAAIVSPGRVKGEVTPVARRKSDRAHVVIVGNTSQK